MQVLELSWTALRPVGQIQEGKARDEERSSCFSLLRLLPAGICQAHSYNSLNLLVCLFFFPFFCCCLFLCVFYPPVQKENTISTTIGGLSDVWFSDHTGKRTMGSILVEAVSP
ncbi:unnamed protein product [Polarella glacialis]|uniref:Uncharacterized protein n=1 Tax=Polarella glacialis TaxID=89957 RepID=A0A813GB71_POLGL|nr:unnamed protein product [Polarella glacialis]